MIRSVLMILLIALSPLAAHAELGPPSDQSQRDFRAANEKALSGDHAAAIALYQSLLDRGIVNEDVLFNLGNAQAQSDDLVGAVVSYERALRITPSSPELRANLRSVRKRLARGRQIGESVPQPVDAIELLVRPLPERALRTALLISNALFFVLLFARRRTERPSRRRAMSIGSALCAALLVLSGVIVAGQEWVRRDVRAVLLESSTLEQGPHLRFDDRGPAHPGDRARILEEDGPWSHVLLDDGTSGWTQTDKLARIDSP